MSDEKRQGPKKPDPQPGHGKDKDHRPPVVPPPHKPSSVS